MAKAWQVDNPMEEQMSRFIASLRGSLARKSEQPTPEIETQLKPDDLALIEQFVEHIDQAQQGRAEREADPEYQAELQADLQRLGGTHMVR